MIAPDSPPQRIPDTTPPRERVRVLNDLAGRSSTHPRIADLAKRLRARVRGGDWRALAAAALALVQRVPYVDEGNLELFAGPVWTLQHGGDCDDLAALLVAVLLALGIPARVEWLEVPGEDFNHYSTLVGPARLWAETILPGARLGEHPFDAARRLGGLRALSGASRAGAPAIAPGGALAGDPWRELIDPAGGWVQWVQLEKAGRWFSEARRLFDALPALEGQPYHAQLAGTRAAFRALGLGYRSLDLPPVIDPVFRVVTLDSFGQVVSLDPEDVTRQRFRPMVAQGVEYTPNGPVRATIQTRWIAEWERLGKNVSDFLRHPRSWAVRCWLDGSGTVIESCSGNPFEPAAQGWCSYAPGLGHYNACARLEAPGEQCDPYRWDVMNWHDPPQTTHATPPAWRFLSPLKWFAEWGTLVARACAARGAMATLEQSRLFQLTINARTAIENGLIEGGTPDTNALIAAATAIPADTLRAQWNNPEILAQSRRLAAFGAQVARINPIFGQAIQIGSSLLGVLPGAVGHLTDNLGRQPPVYERPWIQERRGGPPTYSVPEPEPRTDGPTPTGTVPFLWSLALSPEVSPAPVLGPDVEKPAQSSAIATQEERSRTGLVLVGTGVTLTAASFALGLWDRARGLAPSRRRR